jgi:hypothetical protein
VGVGEGNTKLKSWRIAIDIVKFYVNSIQSNYLITENPDAQFIITNINICNNPKSFGRCYHPEWQMGGGWTVNRRNLRIPKGWTRGIEPGQFGVRSIWVTTPWPYPPVYGQRWTTAFFRVLCHPATQYQRAVPFGRSNRLSFTLSYRFCQLGVNVPHPLT